MKIIGLLSPSLIGPPLIPGGQGGLGFAYEADVLRAGSYASSFTMSGSPWLCNATNGHEEGMSLFSNPVQDVRIYFREGFKYVAAFLITQPSGQKAVLVARQERLRSFRRQDGSSGQIVPFAERKGEGAPRALREGTHPPGIVLSSTPSWAELSSLELYDTSGSFLRNWGDRVSPKPPQALAQDNNGAIYQARWAPSTLAKLDKEGRLCWTVPVNSREGEDLLGISAIEVIGSEVAAVCVTIRDTYLRFFNRETGHFLRQGPPLRSDRPPYAVLPKWLREVGGRLAAVCQHETLCFFNEDGSIAQKHRPDQLPLFPDLWGEPLRGIAFDPRGGYVFLGYFNKIAVQHVETGNLFLLKVPGMPDFAEIESLHIDADTGSLLVAHHANEFVPGPVPRSSHAPDYGCIEVLTWETWLKGLQGEKGRLRLP